MAPFQVVLVPLNLHKSYGVKEVADQLYHDLLAAGIDVLMDERKERLGVKFADMDLIGIPHRIVIGEKGIDAGTVEYKACHEGDPQYWLKTEMIERLKVLLSHH